MGIEYNSVTGCDHAYRITNYRFRRVGTGSDAADDAEGCHLGEGKTVVACLDRRDDICRAGRLVRNENVLCSLMIYSAHLSLSYAKASHNGRFLTREVADDSDELLALLK